MPTRGPNQPLRILIVEDNADTLRLLESLLRSEGFHTRAASTAADAVKLLAWLPHLIILDLMLPDGNGIVVLQRVRDMNLDCRVAITTGMQDGSFDLVLPLHPDRVFQKPLDLDDLLAWVRSSTPPPQP